MAINSVSLCGNLTRDMEVRATSSGYPIGQVGIAVNERRRNKQTGEWEDNPNFFDLVILGERATSLAQYLTKGAKVAVLGKLRFTSWEKDGQRRSKVDVIVDSVEFLSPRQGAAPAPMSAPQPTAAPAMQPAVQPAMAPQAPMGYQQATQAYQAAPQAMPAQQPMPAPAQQPMAAPAQAGLYSDDIPF